MSAKSKKKGANSRRRRIKENIKEKEVKLLETKRGEGTSEGKHENMK